MMVALLAAWAETPVLAAPQALVAGWWAESVRLPMELRTRLAALAGSTLHTGNVAGQILPQTQLAADFHQPGRGRHAWHDVIVCGLWYDNCRFGDKFQQQQRPAG